MSVLNKIGVGECMNKIGEDTAYPIYNFRCRWSQNGEHDSERTHRHSGLPSGRIWNSASGDRMFKEEPKISVLQFNKRTKIGYKFETHDWSKDEFAVFKSCQSLWKHANPKFSGPDVLELQETISLQ